MSITYYDNSQLDRIVKKKIKPSLSALDIGCGIRPNQLLKTRQHICIEPFFEYVEKIKELIPFERYIIMQSTWV